MAIPIITIPAPSRSMWTDDEIAVLRHYCGRMTYKELAKLLPGRTDKGVRQKARMLGLVDTSRSAPAARYKDFLTPKGLRQLREMAARAKTKQELAEMMGTTRDTLRAWERQFGVIARAIERGHAQAKGEPDPIKQRGESLRKKSRAALNEKCARCAWATPLVRNGTQILCSRQACVKEVGDDGSDSR